MIVRIVEISNKRPHLPDIPQNDIYHYASASYQFGGLTPPPPAPSLNGQDPPSPSPAEHQKSFNTVVYQAPSLNDVDQAAMVRYIFIIIEIL